MNEQQQSECITDLDEKSGDVMMHSGMRSSSPTVVSYARHCITKDGREERDMRTWPQITRN